MSTHHRECKRSSPHGRHTACSYSPLMLQDRFSPCANPSFLQHVYWDMLCQAASHKTEVSYSTEVQVLSHAYRQTTNSVSFQMTFHTSFTCVEHHRQFQPELSPLLLSSSLDEAMSSGRWERDVRDKKLCCIYWQWEPYFNNAARWKKSEPDNESSDWIFRSFVHLHMYKYIFDLYF